MENINFDGAEIGFPNLKNGQLFNVLDLNVVNTWLQEVVLHKKNVLIVVEVLRF